MLEMVTLMLQETEDFDVQANKPSYLTNLLLHFLPPFPQLIQK